VKVYRCRKQLHFISLLDERQLCWQEFSPPIGLNVKQLINVVFYMQILPGFVCLGPLLVRCLPEPLHLRLVSREILLPSVIRKSTVKGTD
jgi:hypothetical protein